MRISTKLFNNQSLKNFDKLNSKIQSTQEKISTGKNILSASDDPIGAVNLSVAKDQMELLNRFEKNANSAKSRLGLADQIFNQTVNTLTRIMELTIQAGSGTGEKTGIIEEINALNEVMLEMANSKDTQGQSLFSGFKTNKIPFEVQSDGTTKYLGDRGKHSVQLSESMKVNTTVDGSTAFMRIKTKDGIHGVFDIIQNSINSVKTASEFKRQASANAHAEINFTLPSDPQKWKFNLEGSQGTQQISVELASGKLDKTLIPAINNLTLAEGAQVIIINNSFSKFFDWKCYSER